MADAEKWLVDHGLGKYKEVFRDNDVDMRALPHLTEDDLRELGLSLGHRRIFLAAIRSESTSPAAAPDPSPAPEAAPASEPAGSLLAGARTEAEYRHLSVAFVDMAGSTQLAETLEPEDMSDLLRQYHDKVVAQVERFGGYVAKYMGDGVLAYFGWPEAYEDHAERAVRAGLAIVDDIRRVEPGQPAPYAVRVGVASGKVVAGDLVGDQMREDNAMVGAVVNLAARLQGETELNSVALSEETRDLIGRGFDLRELGPRMLKGFETLRKIYLAIDERALETRFEATRSEYDIPIVGRDEEMALLMRAWSTASTGKGQVILLSGEAGIGKSRITQAFLDSLDRMPGDVLRYQCAPYHVNSAFHPIAERLRRAAGLSRSTDPDQNLEQIEELVEAHFLDRDRDAPVYAKLLGVALRKDDALSGLEPQDLKRRIIDTLARSVAARAERYPLLLVLEDAHWIDPSSLEAFERVVEICGDLPVMLLVTHRTDWTCDWPAGHPHVSALRLGPLSSEQIALLIEGVLDRPVEPALIEELVDRTDGVPLFVEELARAIGDSADGEVQAAVPESLQGALLARLERVSRKARSLSLVASVIGREFDRDLLGDLSGVPPPKLEAALAELRRANIIYESGLAPGSFVFRHALIQDAAYQALLRRNRRTLHGKLARTLERLRGAEVSREPELAARHFTEAGETAEALSRWEAATRRALERSATYEAVNHAKEALAAAEDLAGKTGPTVEVTRARILLTEAYTQSGNLPVALKTAWQAAGEAREHDDPLLFSSAAISYMDAVMLSADNPKAAIDLCEEALADKRIDDVRLRCKLLAHLARGHMMNGSFMESTRFGRKAEALARELGDNNALFNEMMSRFLAPVVARDPEEVANWRDRVQQLLDLADLTDDADRGRAASIATYVGTEMGDRTLMEEALGRLDDVGAVRQHMHLDWVARHGRAMKAILDGDFVEAERLANEALKLGVTTHGSHVEGLYGVQMFTIRREQGRLAEVAPVIKRLLNEGEGDLSWKPGFALIAAELGHLEPAAQMMRAMSADGFDLPLDAKYSATLGYLADTAAMIGDTEICQMLYDRLLPYRGLTITIGVATVCYGSADRRLGVLAAQVGDWTRMEEHFEAALAMDTSMDAVPWLARTKAGYAMAMQARGRSGDIPSIDRLLQEAMETAAKFGMVGLKATLRHDLN
ncbi:ATP-binding protein [Lutimaribacter marinistellae]|uniref:ATP-binding protein n=1 Tax=Lutimaribacter marinistellae TaxID=1820329 RepID=A0ABV7TNC1_9RHOB